MLFNAICALTCLVLIPIIWRERRRQHEARGWALMELFLVGASILYSIVSFAIASRQRNSWSCNELPPLYFYTHKMTWFEFWFPAIAWLVGSTRDGLLCGRLASPNWVLNILWQHRPQDIQVRRIWVVERLSQSLNRGEPAGLPGEQQSISSALTLAPKNKATPWDKKTNVPLGAAKVLFEDWHRTGHSLDFSNHHNWRQNFSVVRSKGRRGHKTSEDADCVTARIDHAMREIPGGCSRALNDQVQVNFQESSRVPGPKGTARLRAREGHAQISCRNASSYCHW